MAVRKKPHCVATHTALVCRLLAPHHTHTFCSVYWGQRPSIRPDQWCMIPWNLMKPPSPSPPVTDAFIHSSRAVSLICPGIRVGVFRRTPHPPPLCGKYLYILCMAGNRRFTGRAFPLDDEIKSKHVSLGARPAAEMLTWWWHLLRLWNHSHSPAIVYFCVVLF